MLKLKLLGAAVIVSVAIATPALAAVIDEPGAYAFYHPNGDLGLGSARPDAAASQLRDSNARALRMSAKTHHRASSIKSY